MNDLIEFEDVIADLRDGLNDVHFDREPPTRRSTVRRMAWVPAVAAGLVVMFLAISPGISDGIAWAAVARPTTPDEQARITEDCAESLATTPGDWPDTLPLLMTSEVRGNTASLNFAGDGWFVTCVVAELSRNDGYEPGLSVVSMGYDHELTEGDGAVRFNILGLAPDPIDGPEGVEATTFVTGVVSEEVVRVVIDVPDLGEVEATVANGWFTAWWPSRQPFVVRGLASDNNPIVEVPLPDISSKARGEPKTELDQQIPSGSAHNGNRSGSAPPVRVRTTVRGRWWCPRSLTAARVLAAIAICPLAAICVSPETTTESGWWSVIKDTLGQRGRAAVGEPWRRAFGDTGLLDFGAGRSPNRSRARSAVWFAPRRC